MKLRDRIGTGAYYFILALLPQLIFVAAASYGFITYRNNEVRALLQEDERMYVNNAFYRVSSALDGVVSDLFILSKSDSLREFVAQEANTFELAKTFTLIARERKIYNKISYIDGSGQELIVINYDGNRPYLEWPEKLKNLRSTPEFRRVSELAPGAVYFSHVKGAERSAAQKNTDSGFMTVATPVFDKQGKHQGMVALYLKRAPFLELVWSQWSGTTPGSAMVVSSDGRFILMPSQSNQNISSQSSPMTRFDLMYPESWETIKLNGQGQHLDSAGLFTYETLSDEVIEAFHGASLNVVMEQGDVDQSYTPYTLNIIGFVPSSVIQAYTAVSPFTWIMIVMSIAFATALSTIYMQLKLRHRDADKNVRLVAHVEKVTRDGVVIYDDNKRVVSVNPAFTILTGFLPYEVLGKTSAFFREESFDDEELEPLLSVAKKKDSAYREVKCINKKGVKFPIASTVSVMRTPQGRVENYIEIFSDITYLKRKESKLLKQAYYDALTSVPNRLLFEERLKMVLKNSRRRGEKFALLFIDINDFKGVNDRYGHEVGDRVLIHVADGLSSSVRDSDTVARLGGDEFVVIANNIAAREDADLLVDKLTTLVESPMTLDTGEELVVRVSVGVSIYPEDSDSETGLTKVADMEMYRNKAQKKSAEVLSDITKQI